MYQEERRIEENWNWLEEDYCEKQKNLRGAGLSTSQVSSKKSLEKKGLRQ